MGPWIHRGSQNHFRDFLGSKRKTVAIKSLALYIKQKSLGGIDCAIIIIVVLRVLVVLWEREQMKGVASDHLV